MTRSCIYPLVLSCFLGACAGPSGGTAEVRARGQTVPVADSDDAADDPAIWIHPTDPAQSLVLGTNKKAGLCVYTLSGDQVAFFPVGRLNNVDLRQGVLAEDGSRLDIAAASHRDHNGISLFVISPGGIRELTGSPVPVSVKEPYGLCCALPASGTGLRVFVNDKEGRIEEWLVRVDAEGVAGASLASTRKLPSQVEGMVADEANGRLFVGEERVGIWSFPLDGPNSTRGSLIARASWFGPLRPDVEGLTIAPTGAQSGYLLCSSQGDNTLVAYDRAPPHEYRGKFRIVAGAVGSVEETDGIDVCTRPLGPLYPSGVLVTQDGENTPAPQNFKLTPWDEVAQALDATARRSN